MNPNEMNQNVYSVNADAVPVCNIPDKVFHQFQQDVLKGNVQSKLDCQKRFESITNWWNKRQKNNHDNHATLVDMLYKSCQGATYRIDPTCPYPLGGTLWESIMYTCAFYKDYIVVFLAATDVGCLTTSGDWYDFLMSNNPYKDAVHNFRRFFYYNDFEAKRDGIGRDG